LGSVEVAIRAFAARGTPCKLGFVGYVASYFLPAEKFSLVKAVAPELVRVFDRQLRPREDGFSSNTR
jgi:hypothetical protein